MTMLISSQYINKQSILIYLSSVLVRTVSSRCLLFDSLEIIGGISIHCMRDFLNSFSKTNENEYKKKVVENKQMLE